MKAILFVSFILATSFVFADEPSPIGVWLVQDKDAKAEVYEKDGMLEAKLVWLKEPKEKDGTEKLDAKNPDKELAKLPLMNSVFLTGFKKEKNENKWSGGKIYDAKSGNTYKAWMKPDGPDKMKLRGYVGISLFGRSEEWTRVVEPTK